MIDEKLVDTLKEHFDLNSYEAKVWLALLMRGHTACIRRHTVEVV